MCVSVCPWTDLSPRSPPPLCLTRPRISLTPVWLPVRLILCIAVDDTGRVCDVDVGYQGSLGGMCVCAVRSSEHVVSQQRKVTRHQAYARNVFWRAASSFSLSFRCLSFGSSSVRLSSLSFVCVCAPRIYFFLAVGEALGTASPFPHRSLSFTATHHTSTASGPFFFLASCLSLVFAAHYVTPLPHCFSLSFAQEHRSASLTHFFSLMVPVRHAAWLRMRCAGARGIGIFVCCLKSCRQSTAVAFISL